MAARDPWKEYRQHDPQSQWNDFKRSQGDYEVTASVNNHQIAHAWQWIKTLFKKEKTK